MIVPERVDEYRLEAWAQSHVTETLRCPAAVKSAELHRKNHRRYALAGGVAAEEFDGAINIPLRLWERSLTNVSKRRR